MIRRILNSRLPLMVYNPVKVFDIKYFKDIFNSGALPLFDTEFLSDDDIIEKALLLSREYFCFGIRLYNHDIDLIEKIRHLQLVNLDLLICPVAHNDETADFSHFLFCIDAVVFKKQ